MAELVGSQRENRAARVPLRVARTDELDTLCDIDRDASQLFERAGLNLTFPNDVELAAAERRRWLECLRSGTTVLASDWTGEPVGFAALTILDGEPYLEQLSVRMRAMRHGIGTLLLAVAETIARQTPARTLWLTTYRHLPWNRRFYERAGFNVSPPKQWGREITQEVLFQRRLLPHPDERVVMCKVLSPRIERPRVAPPSF
jgi:GNAT superfamily N-acetyltransferase